MRGNRNLEVYMKFLTVAALALFLVYELLSGKVYYYVHPRYLYGIWLAVAALLVFAGSLLGELRKGRHNSSLKQYFLYLIPIAMALLFPVVEGGNGNIAIAQSSKGINSRYESNATDKTDNGKREVSGDAGGASSAGGGNNTAGEAAEDSNNIAEGTAGEGTGNNTENNTDSNAENSTDNTAWSVSEDTPEEKDRSLKYKNKADDGAILISDDDYGCWYFELFDFLKDFKGKRYRFTAQVFSMEGLKAGQFLAGRYIMTCCAVDLTGYGIITESSLSSKLKENQWITVTGTVGEYDYKGSKVPVLKDVEISETKAPKEEYVYYYYY